MINIYKVREYLIEIRESLVDSDAIVDTLWIKGAFNTTVVDQLDYLIDELNLPVYDTFKEVKND